MKTSLTVRLVTLLVPVLLLAACIPRQPIRVGFSGELTGRNAELGVSGRNGAQLAVEEINTKGGVGGRSLELVVRDDLGTPEGAQAADRALIEAGVVAIVGHMTSAPAVAAVPIVDEAGVVLISPTAATWQLTSLDDHFFRVSSDSVKGGVALAVYVSEDRGLSRLSAIYDTDNAAFTETYVSVFEDTFTSLGGQIVDSVPFSSADEPDLSSVLVVLEAGNPEGLLIVASAAETALIAQTTRRVGWEVPLFGTGWAQTETLIRAGGRAVEGLELERLFDPNSQSPAFQDFRVRYEERYGNTPIFAAAQAYEAMMLMVIVLEGTGGEAEGLREALIAVRSFDGLTGTIIMDEFGDARRAHYLLTVRDGEFITLKTLTSEPLDLSVGT